MPQKLRLTKKALLRALIESYLCAGIDIFPEKTLKPKHHYPQLILQFGPLIRLWTLRFESKHTYFKQCARKLHNFKSLCSTLAKRHQLFQAYLGTGFLLPSSVIIDKGIEFYINPYSDDIQNCVVDSKFQVESTVAA